MNYIESMITDGLAFGLPLFIMALGGIFASMARKQQLEQQLKAVD